MFKEQDEDIIFDWNMLGDIDAGRPNLGNGMAVSVYRLMQFTLRGVLAAEYGAAAADRIFYLAGKKAGQEFFKNVIGACRDFNELALKLQDALRDLKIGIVRFERVDLQKMEFVITVEEDLDCSGLPVTGETVCVYDEGFISGILLEYSGKEFTVKEVDCWCTGARTCRFSAVLCKIAQAS